ncbi:MAG: FIST N-terminal domain-containing protein, partial [Chitinophagaceae bacterium]
MKAKSIKGNSPEEIKGALEQSMDDGFKPTLAFVFISIKQDRKAICEILHNEGIDIVGATSCGEFIDGYQDEGSIVILLLNLHRDAYTILFEAVGDRNLADVATHLAQNALKKFKHPGFILCSTGVSAAGEFLDGKLLVHSIENVVGPQANIYGGMAGDDATFTGTYVFTYEHSTDMGMAALVVDEDKISLSGMAISGWKPMGIIRTVTKSEGPWLYTIDGQPALQMYYKYLGKEPITGDDDRKIFEEIGLFYPFLAE